MKFAGALTSSILLATPALAAFTVTYSDVSGSTFKATVTSDKNITILKHPNTVAAPQFDTDIFKFESEDGKVPAFRGVALKWDPEASEKLELKAGEPVVFEQDLSKAYEFSGNSTYKLSGGDVFFVLSPSGEVTTETAKVVLTTAKFSGSVDARKGEYTPVYGSHEKRVITWVGCNPARKTITTQAAIRAQFYIVRARNYLALHTGGTSPRWSWWFGPWSAARRAFVHSHFNSMVNDAMNVRYDCSTCPTIQYANAYAYVYPNVPTTIYLCGAFWNAPLIGTDSKGGTIVHELSHYTVNGGTGDYAFGQGNAHALATGNPFYAIRNADNHEYFAENTPYRA